MPSASRGADSISTAPRRDELQFCSYYSVKRRPTGRGHGQAGADPHQRSGILTLVGPAVQPRDDVESPETTAARHDRIPQRLARSSVGGQDAGPAQGCAGRNRRRRPEGLRARSPRSGCRYRPVRSDPRGECRGRARRRVYRAPSTWSQVCTSWPSPRVVPERTGGARVRTAVSIVYGGGVVAPGPPTTTGSDAPHWWRREPRRRDRGATTAGSDGSSRTRGPAIGCRHGVHCTCWTRAAGLRCCC